MNNESGSDSGEWLENNGDTFELSTELIDVKKVFGELSEDDQRLLELKTLGNTYEEIAEEMGFATLHKARQRHMVLLDRLSAND
jgi:DNA-directed RNA polymerase specialized sigma24 family protein